MTGRLNGFAVLALIDNYWPAYSISSVVRSQLLGIQELGGPFPFINVTDGECPEEFKGERRFVDRLHLQDWATDLCGPNWVENADALIPSFRKALEGVTTLLANDILMQGWYLPYLWALRKVLDERPDLHVYHLIHSGPSPRQTLKETDPRHIRFELHEQECVLYNNSSDIAWIQAMYDSPAVLPIHNPIAVEDFFDLPERVLKIYKDMALYDADVITMYPTRLSEGKQIDKWLGVIGGLKAVGAKVRGILVNSYSTGESEHKMLQSLTDYGRSLGLVKGKDFCFTSELCDAPIGLDRREVSALSRLCNVFIQTSLSETCSLIMLEAMVSRQLLVLNTDLDCNLSGELMGNWAIPARFSGLHRKTEYTPNFEAYCRDLAQQIMNRLGASGEQIGFLRAMQLHSRKAYAEWLLNVMNVLRLPPSRRAGLVDLPQNRGIQQLPISHKEQTEAPAKLDSPGGNLRALEPEEGGQLQ